MAVNYSGSRSYSAPQNSGPSQSYPPPWNYSAPRDYSQPPGDPSAGATKEERPIGELFANLGGQVSLLVQKEIELARLEVQDQASKAAKAGAMFGAVAVVVFLASILVSFAAAWGLAEVIPTGFAFLAVGVLYAIVAAVLFAQGRRRLRQVKPVPAQTIKTLKDDVDVAKSSVSRGMSGPPSELHGRREYGK
ncbi:MAG TPA: phage holin family protein [Acidimicrobiales bacterium]|nr:phage holin family protein [Acidimicrobiales bacterium]